MLRSKVRVEAFCWGAGTAIGELPPYFMARAARLSGGLEFGVCFVVLKHFLRV